jgi:hypothetical protein
MKTIVAAAACAAALSGVAAAQNAMGAGGMTIEEAAAILVSEGLAAELEQGGEAGKIISAVAGARFELLSVNCNGAKRCTEFLFVAGFDLADGFPLERINAWNADAIAGRAFLDEENDPFLDHVISVSGPRDHGAFREGLYLWEAAVGEFVDFIDLPMAEA